MPQSLGIVSVLPERDPKVGSQGCRIGQCKQLDSLKYCAYIIFVLTC